MVDRIRISVGSKNPVKISAAEKGALKSLSIDAVDILGFDVPSGVSVQPMTDEETRTGALNRAKNAYEAWETLNGQRPHYSVGLEGGVMEVGAGELQCFAWIAVYDGAKIGFGRTGAFTLPPRVCELVLRNGMELGDADDIVFGAVNSKQKAGAVGHLTKGVIDRAAYYEHAVVLAFIPFHWPDLY